MRVLAPSEAFSPAWQRTKKILPRFFFNLRNLKFCGLLFVSELVGLGIALPPFLNKVPPANVSRLHGPSLKFLHLMHAFSGIFWFGFLLLGLVLFYVGCRLQFVCYEFVITGNPSAGAMWARYAQKTKRWIPVRMVLHLILLVLSACIIAALIKTGVHGRASLSGIIFLINYCIAFLASLLRDFLLPVLALEDVTLSGALHHVRQLIEDCPGEFAKYIVFRILVGVCTWFAAILLMIAIISFFSIPLGLGMGILAILLHSSPAFLLVLMPLMMVAMLAIALFAFIWVSGYAEAFRIAYGAYFFGGRYQPLGDSMEPPAVAAPSPEPSA